MPANEPKQSLPEIDFATFVLSLASNALVHLGELPEPGEGGGDGEGGGVSEDEDADISTSARERNLPLARQTIEILAMLEQKTRGNLDAAEANLLGGVLYDLRMKFVDAAKGTKAK
jgi:hypothetical protein